MPPKKDIGASKKTEQKKVAKVIDDKTFGLKNKNKSKVVQSYIKGVAIQVNQKLLGKGSEAKLVTAEYLKKEQEKKEEETNALLSSLFKSVTTIKQVEAKEGEDAKSIVCAYFKAGVCQKGKKCKFSHDLEVENKSAKIDLYTDQRGIGKAEDTMDTWDDDTLKKAVEENQKKYKSQKPTEIICKYFLDAVEAGKYGWFWTCPNGTTCIYRHCLPPGYVLKRDLPKIEDIEKIAIEEKIEEERRKLGSKGTPVTLERFLVWKEKKKIQKDIEESKKMEDAKKQGAKGLHLLSGRALFKFDPSLFADDDDAAEGADYDDREQEQDEKVAPLYNEEDEDEEEDEEGEDEEEKQEESQGDNEQNDDQQQENGDNEEESDVKEENFQKIKIQRNEEETVSTQVTTESNVKEEENNESVQAVEKKKKKKNKNKKKKEEENNGVKINEDVFQDDVELPDDLE